jgi:hypothetical protein
MAHEWKVRSMDEVASRAAVAAAMRAGVNTAEWLAEAINARLAHERDSDGLTGEVLPPGAEVEVETASPVTRPDVELDELIRIAATPTLPQWLRSGAAKHIATTIHVSWPSRGPRKALQAPEAEDVGKAVDELLGR